MPISKLIDEAGKEITRAEIEPGKYVIFDGICVAAGDTVVKKEKKR